MLVSRKVLTEKQILLMRSTEKTLSSEEVKFSSVNSFNFHVCVFLFSPLSGKFC